MLSSTLPLAYFADQEAKAVLKEQALKDAAVKTANNLDNIDRFIHQRISDIKSMAQNPMLRTPQADITLVNQQLEAFQQLNELYYSISFFTIDRVRLADTKGNAIGQQHSATLYWQKLSANNPFVMDISRSESVGKIVIHFAALVRDFNNRPTGVVVSRVLIDKLYEVFEDNTLENKSKQPVKVDLVDSVGIIMYSNHSPEKVLQDYYPQKEILTLLQQASEGYLEDKQQVYFFAKEKGYLTYKGNHWALVLTIQANQIFMPIQYIRQRLFSWFFVTLLGGVAIAFLVAHRFTLPIVMLSKIAKRIGEGDWDATYQVKTHDEIRILGVQLQRMAQRLKLKLEELSKLNTQLNESNLYLEDRVRQINEQKHQIELKNDQIALQHTQLAQALSEIQYKNKQITESLEYARRIQESMLPSDKLLQEFFQDYFIYFRPLTAVSGDFYWFEKIEQTDKTYFVIAVADCTGHGVPGAILSMLGSNLLTQITQHNQLIDPAAILLKLNAEIKYALNQERNYNNNQDGMEVALLVFDVNQRQVHFAGGGRPLYFVHDAQLFTIEGDKITIGGVSWEQRYLGAKKPIHIETHTLSYTPGDTFYLFTDGYKDQFGGEKGRKMGTDRFKKHVLANSSLMLTQQYTEFDRFFKQWRGQEDQIDDVLVLGLRC